MSGLLETKEAVQHWYNQGDSAYFTGELRSALQRLYGEECTAKIESRLDAVFYEFKEFKLGNLTTISEQPSSDSKLSDLLTRSFFCSAKAYEEYRRGRRSLALKLLRQSMTIDAELCEKHDIRPMLAHFYQSRHNVCRLLAACGKVAYLQRYIADTLELIVNTRSHGPRERILLELMGFQVLSHYIGLVEKGELTPAMLKVDSQKSEASHLSLNIALFNSIVLKDQRRAIQLLSRKDTFFLVTFRKHISM